METPLPVPVLTGYWGTDKTALLNCILTYKYGKKGAVIVHEFGEVDINNQLKIARLDYSSPSVVNAQTCHMAGNVAILGLRQCAVTHASRNVIPASVLPFLK